MSTFNIPILPFLCIFLKTTQLSCKKKNNSTRPLNSKIKANTGEKQLNSSVGMKQLNSAAGTNNSTRQQERKTPLGNMNETTQLVSRNETTELCTAVDRLQPPTTAYNRLQPPAPPLQQNRLFLPTDASALLSMYTTDVSVTVPKL
ncbi:hypothetical protein TNCV_3952071 [Trichonephila clavipes]|uniref:Uncharacterized protein n=1 Tax=Trichonephila clavipes TaxID=2585209 RepID=A0A8X6S4S7_TRICX|nr:hypothetical protein TNCV_3952071 [Trichonephila clavipes]